MINQNELARRIEEELKKRERVCIAVDGPSASGKTTLAARLAALFPSVIVHMDDFYLPKAEHCYALDGGNMDLDRLKRDVLLPLKKGERVAYTPFLCQTQTLGQTVWMDPCPLIIVEGSYALHPSLYPLYDLTVLLSVDREEQRRRILLRNKEGAAAFFDKWIPLEDRYLAALSEDKTRIVTFRVE